MRTGLSLGRDLDPIEDVPDQFDFIEFGIGEHEQPHQEIDVDKLRQRLDAQELSATVHLPFRQPIATTVPVFNEAVIDYFDQLMDWASKIGAEKAVVHANMRDPEDADEYDVLHDQVIAIQALGDRHGVQPVFENVGHLDTPLLFELGEVLEKTGADMCFDTGHAFVEAEPDIIADFLDVYADLITHLHVQDIRKHQDSHILVGEGRVDFGMIADHLSGFDGTACLEIFTDEMDYLALAQDKFLQYFE